MFSCFSTAAASPANAALPAFSSPAVILPCALSTPGRRNGLAGMLASGAPLSWMAASSALLIFGAGLPGAGWRVALSEGTPTMTRFSDSARMAAEIAGALFVTLTLTITIGTFSRASARSTRISGRRPKATRFRIRIATAASELQ